MPFNQDEISSVLADRHVTFRMLMNHPQNKSEMDDRLECSRSTINRAIRELRDAELIRYENGVWKPTLLGKHAYSAREEYHCYLLDLVQAKPLFDDLPGDDTINRDILDGSEVHQTRASIPDAVLHRLFDHITKCDYFRLFTPVLLQRFLEESYERLTTSSVEKIDMIVPEHALQAFREVNPTLIKMCNSTQRLNLYQSVSTFPFGIWLRDTSHAGLVAYAEHGPSGVLINDSECAVNWVEEKFERLEKHDISKSLLDQH